MRHFFGFFEGALPFLTRKIFIKCFAREKKIISWTFKISGTLIVKMAHLVSTYNVLVHSATRSETLKC
jgi:hypothetical protein